MFFHLCFLLFLVKVTNGIDVNLESSVSDYSEYDILEDADSSNTVCDCGQPTTNERIVNGKEAKIKDFPWVVLIKIYEGSNSAPSMICGGALIHTKHVLTAAHCVEKTSILIEGSRRLKVIIGEQDVNKKGESGNPELETRVIGIKRHPEYKKTKTSMSNDIAILELEDSVVLSDNKRIICIASMDTSTYESETAKVAGWGLEKFGGASVSKDLLYTNLKVLSNDYCNTNTGYKGRLTIQDNQMCAVSANTDKISDACQGDSGGPLFIKKDNNKYYVIGIVSFGRQCGNKDYPGVFTRVSSYSEWIKSVIPNGEICGGRK